MPHDNAESRRDEEHRVHRETDQNQDVSKHVVMDPELTDDELVGVDGQLPLNVETLAVSDVLDASFPHVGCAHPPERGPRRPRYY